MFIDQLELNHIGVVVAKDDFERIATSKNCELIEDKIQGVRVFLNWTKCFKRKLNILLRRPRCKCCNWLQPLLLQHKGSQQLDRLHTMMKDNKTGFRLTFPERSAAREYCNLVVFYKTIYGIVEFNIVN